MNVIKLVDNDSNTLNMGDNERVVVPEEMNDYNVGGAGGDEHLMWLRLLIYFHILCMKCGA